MYTNSKSISKFSNTIIFINFTVFYEDDPTIHLFFYVSNRYFMIELLIFYVVRIYFPVLQVVRFNGVLSLYDENIKLFFSIISKILVLCFYNRWVSWFL